MVDAIVVDTMHVVGMLTDASYLPFAKAIDGGFTRALMSAISITEILKVLGARDRSKAASVVHRLKRSPIEILPVTVEVAERAGELRLLYGIPTADALIAATGLVTGTRYILTEDHHFQCLRPDVLPIRLHEVLEFLALAQPRIFGAVAAAPFEDTSTDGRPAPQRDR